MQQLQHVLPQRSAVQECQGGGRRSGHAGQQSAAAVLQVQGDMAACEAAVQPADPRQQLQPPVCAADRQCWDESKQHANTPLSAQHCLGEGLHSFSVAVRSHMHLALPHLPAVCASGAICASTCCSDRATSLLSSVSRLTQPSAVLLAGVLPDAAAASACVTSCCRCSKTLAVEPCASQWGHS